MKLYSLIFIFVTGITNLFGQSGFIKDSIESSLRRTFSSGSFEHIDHIMQFNKDTFLVAGYFTGLLSKELLMK